MTPTPEQLQNRILWVEALRSGKYEQTTECLHDEKGYCCLGVACDVLGMKWVEDGDSHQYAVHGITDLLPLHAVDAFGFDRDSPIIQVGDELKALADLNDDGSDLKELADLIDRHLIVPFQTQTA